MFVLLVVIFSCLATFDGVHGYRGPFRRMDPTQKPTIVKSNDDPGEPLFLTPYIEKGQIDEARRLRSVVNLFSFFFFTFDLFVIVQSNYHHTNSNHLPAI